MASKLIRYVGTIMAFWLVLFIYMGFSLFQLVEESQKATTQLQQVNLEMELLKRENDKLRVAHVSQDVNRIAHQFKESQGNDQHLDRVQRNLDNLGLSSKLSVVNNVKMPSGPSSEYEKLRRRVKKDVQEMWYFISAQVTKIIEDSPPPVKKKLRNVLKEFAEHHSYTQNDMDDFAATDGMQDFRQDLHLQLSALIQKRLQHLQNPKDCDSARKLVCRLNKGCGYGCQMHNVLYCFIVAYATKRTLIIDSSGWRYSPRGWESIFLPVSSTCTTFPAGTVDWSTATDASLSVNLPIVDSLYPRPKQMPLAVPKDIASILTRFHGHPFVWWIGQFSAYLFRFQPGIQQTILEKKKKLGFASPIVGVQIRRTDKINLEAAFHDLKEYMYWVDLYYQRLALKQKVEKKRVFLASDDDKVLLEAQKSYTDYEFLSDNDISKSASLNSRYSETSLHGVISDIDMLSDTDFLVCTFSSQVCRLAYEIMNAKHPDASDKFQSLDDIYYFGGQSKHDVIAFHPHKPADPKELELNTGDLLAIAGNHWDGFSKARSHAYQIDGLFPSYKVEDVTEVVDFPDYSDFDRRK